MGIKVGEYVRTTTGEICKIEKWYGKKCYETDRIIIKYNEVILYEEDIKAHSPYIIDLIEVGDVIKYKELRDWSMYGTKANETYILNLKSQKEVDKFKKCVEDKEIEFVSIVTKEQFAEMEYEV